VKARKSLENSMETEFPRSRAEEKISAGKSLENLAADARPIFTHPPN
jgi:hypothetical protein